METKLSTLKKAAETEDWRKVFSIASKFPRLGTIRNAVLDAHTAFTNPAFLRQLGRDPAVIIEAGKAAIRDQYLTLKPATNDRKQPVQR